jgi:hypothetical protein
MAKRKGLKRPEHKTGNRFQVKPPERTIDYNKLPPIFSLKHMLYQGHSCISRCEQREKANIIDKIQMLSQATWNDIKGWGKELGLEKMPRYRFKVALPANITPEVPILVTRYGNKGGRMAGFQENDIFHIVLVGKDLYSH